MWYMTKLITSDSTFSIQQQNIIAFIADMMIPAEGELPSAADNDIFSDMLVRMAENRSVMDQTFANVEASSKKDFDDEFSNLEDVQKTVVINILRASQPELVKIIQVYIVGSYYQDPRVMHSLGLEPRPPHPGGYNVSATDWSLLEPVRSREKFYRQV